MRAQLRHRRRRAQTGAVLVEGLIVSGVLALLLCCGVFFHRVYSAKLTTLREARAEAWGAALRGCGGGLVGGLMTSLSVITALTEDDQGRLIEDPSTLLEIGRGVGDGAPVTVSAGPLLGSRSFTMRTRRDVACSDYADHAAGHSFFATAFQMIRDLAFNR